MTSCARRCISGLPRCTDAKSRSALEAGADRRPRRRRGRSASPGRRGPRGLRRPSRPSRRARADVAEAAGDHDRLVVAARAPGGSPGTCCSRCGNSRNARPAELVVEGGGADRSLDHDLEGRDDAPGACRRSAPRALGPGMRRLDTVKPTRPAFGFAAAARRAFVADLAAGPGGRAGNGEIAVGWLCVSTFIRMSIGSRRRVPPPPGRRTSAALMTRPRSPRVVAVGGEHALRSCVRACSDHREQRLVARSPVDDELALKILWRQCSEFACANIISSTSVGSRPSAAKASSAGSRSRRRTAPARARRSPRPIASRPRASDTCRNGRGRLVLEQRRRRVVDAAPSRSSGRAAAARWCQAAARPRPARAGGVGRQLVGGHRGHVLARAVAEQRLRRPASSGSSSRATSTKARAPAGLDDLDVGIDASEPLGQFGDGTARARRSHRTSMPGPG